MTTLSRNRPRFTRLAPLWGWEFLRRHPRYLENWQTGNIYWGLTTDQRQQSPDRHKLEAAVRALWEIGISGRCCPDPSASGHDLGLAEYEGLQLARPVTTRDLIQVMSFLSPDTRKQIGALVAQETTAEDLLREVEALNGPEMDQDVTGLIRVNVHASTRSIIENIEKVVKGQKMAHGIQDTRQAADEVYDKYLRVWDLREGFVGGRYEGSEEKRFMDIVVKVSSPLPTVQSRYKTAYALIVGKSYNLIDWLMLFGVLKISSSKLHVWRRDREKQRGQQQPETTQPDDDEAQEPQPEQLPGQLHEGGWCMGDDEDEGSAGRSDYRSSCGVVYDNAELRDLLIDCKDLMAKGLSGHEIAIKLEVSAVDVEMLRERLAEGLGDD